MKNFIKATSFILTGFCVGAGFYFIIKYGGELLANLPVWVIPAMVGAVIGWFNYMTWSSSENDTPITK